jgi:hypothetical protein
MCIVAKTSGINNLSVIFLPINIPPTTRDAKYIKIGVMKTGSIKTAKNIDKRITNTAIGGAR